MDEIFTTLSVGYLETQRYYNAVIALGSRWYLPFKYGRNTGETRDKYGRTMGEPILFRKLWGHQDETYLVMKPMYEIF